MVKYTQVSLEQLLETRRKHFTEDHFGGLRCPNCDLPVIYRTLHLSVVLENTNGGFGVVTTRPWPVCRQCDEWRDQQGHLSVTLLEAQEKGLLRG